MKASICVPTSEHSLIRTDNAPPIGCYWRLIAEPSNLPFNTEFAEFVNI
jgi:hypothetical protein